MKKLLSNPIVARLLGAAGAGAAAYYAGGVPPKAAVVSALGYLVYGAVHSTATAAGSGYVGGTGRGP